jgi:hypothetical protein
MAVLFNSLLPDACGTFYGSRGEPGALATGGNGSVKTRRKWLAIILAVLLLGLGTAFFRWPRDRITAEAWKKIRLGMTEKEVEEILDGPGITLRDFEDKYGGQYHAGKARFCEGGEPIDPDWRKIKVWFSRQGAIAIQLDRDFHVTSKIFQGIRWTEPNLLERLRDWLGW